MMSAPSFGWRFTCSQSGAESRSRLRRISEGTPSLPMSCSGAAFIIMSQIACLAPAACETSLAYCERRMTRLPTAELSCSSITRARHLDVEQDQVGPRRAGRQLERSPGILGGQHLVVVCQHSRGQRKEIARVVDH